MYYVIFDGTYYFIQKKNDLTSFCPTPLTVIGVEKTKKRALKLIESQVKE